MIGGQFKKQRKLNLKITDVKRRIEDEHERHAQRMLDLYTEKNILEYALSKLLTSLVEIKDED